MGMEVEDYAEVFQIAYGRMLALKGIVQLTGDGCLWVYNQDFIVGKIVEMIDNVVDFWLI